MNNAPETPNNKFSFKKFLKSLGPGFITGASDDDPSGIGTYSQVGALFKYSLLWTALFSYPFMTVVQEMCGRIGLVTGKGLAGVIKQHYSKKILYFAVTILLIANTINIGADLGAMAQAAQLLVNVNYVVLLVGMTLFTILLEVFVSYKTYSKILKYLTLSLFAYIFTVFVVKQDWNAIWDSTFVPTIIFNKEYILMIVAILGTTISPYLFFWQASEEVEEEIEEGKIEDMDLGLPTFNKSDIAGMRLDTILGMLFSNLVMFFIIITTASTLGKYGVTSIETAAQAAEALKPLAGNFAFVLFAAGIIGTGLLAVPVLAGSASYAVAETFNWNLGLSKKLKQAQGFYAVITIATLIGFLVNFTSIKPFQMLYYTAVLNGICAPPLLILILSISNNKKIMGNNTNTWVSNLLGIIITVVMTAAALSLFFSFKNTLGVTSGSKL